MALPFSQSLIHQNLTSTRSTLISQCTATSVLGTCLVRTVSECCELRVEQSAIIAAGQLPVPRAAVLKHTLRSIHRMMQSTGTSEGLRGLIDSTLPQSIKKIMEYRGLFGPNLLPLGEHLVCYAGLID